MANEAIDSEPTTVPANGAEGALALDAPTSQEVPLGQPRAPQASLEPAPAEPPPRSESSLGARLERAAAWVATAVCLRPRRILALVIASVIGAAILASQLRVSADLAELLPKTFQSVQDLEALEERVGGIGYVVVVARGAEPEALRRFADDMAPKLSRVDGVRYVEHRKPDEFFRQRALYFMDPEDLEILEDRISRWKERQLALLNPFYFDLEDDEPPSLDFSDLEAKYEGREGPAGLLGRDDDEEPYYLDPEEGVVAIFVKPNGLGANLAFARQVVTGVEHAIEGVDLASYGPELSVGFTGSYKRRIEQQDLIARDLRTASTVAVAAMIAFLLWYFRHPRAVVLVLAPLAVGLCWTFAFAYLTFGTLNILTGFLGAILLGLGIDHGIHLMSRYRVEAARTPGPPQTPGEEDASRLQARVVGSTFAKTGRAIAVAGLTTLLAFAGLAFSEFRAFHEFGVIAAVGMVLVLSAYLLCMPALIGLTADRSSRQAAGGDAAGGTPLGRRMVTRLSRRAGLAVGLFAAACVAVALATPGVRFNEDFMAVQGKNLPSFQLDRVVTRLLGHSQSPVVVPTDTIEEEQKTVHAVRAEQVRRGTRSTIDSALSISDLVPEEQASKRATMDSIQETLAGIDGERLDADARRRLEDLRWKLKPPPFGRTDLPSEVRQRFQGPTSEVDDGVVLVYPAVEQHDGGKVRALARELRSIRLDEGSALRLAAETMILADILDMVVRESPIILAFTAGVLLVLLMLLMARAADAVLCLGAGTVTVGLTLGVLPLVGGSLDYLNVVVIPVLFGLGVDGAVHMVTRVRAGERVSAALSETGRAIAGSILTTALGFGALLLTGHDGLRSIGQLALLGLGVSAAVSLVGVPAVLLLLQRWLRVPALTLAR